MKAFNEFSQSEHIYVKSLNPDIDAVMFKKEIEDDKIILTIKAFEYASARVGIAKRYEKLTINKADKYITDGHGFYMIGEYTLKAL
ncbi:hypothetical protein U5B43_05840 [Campylobacter sp. 9BO]|uniref:hypothetical protein n=1 Tax=Campylobacter sp. 9BO TaxID=3424759 RepID=UPI003D333018